MANLKRRLVERIVEPDYVADLGGRSMEDLRGLRDECRDGEAEISFERRLCQARIDILEAELDRRSGKGDSDLVARLPEILAAQAAPVTGSPLPTRAPDFSIPRNVDVPRRRVNEVVGEQTLARLPQIPTDEAKGILASLAAYEEKLSAQRRLIHDVMDLIQAEIVRRYVSGEVDPTSAAGA
ncbi:MAG TPA: hypothetical protein VNC78_10865 [Actinomycetota bacterium]|nr:hypothetical protein [Actinomycetota bacterium]